MDPLGTDSCRETVPMMEPPMSNGSPSMPHRELKSETYDTRDFLQGAYIAYPPGAVVR